VTRKASATLGVVLLTLLAATSLLAQDGGSGEASEPQSIQDVVAGFEHLPGFLDLYWDGRGGRILLRIDQLESDLLYVESLSAGRRQRPGG